MIFAYIHILIDHPYIHSLSDHAYAFVLLFIACQPIGAFSTGMQQRTRTVKAQHSCGGVQCSFNQLKTTRTCTVYSNVDCKVSSWSTWSACSNGCGSGTSTRTRSVTRPKKCNGKSCASLLETKACQSYRNNRDCVVSVLIHFHSLSLVISTFIALWQFW